MRTANRFFLGVLPISLATDISSAAAQMSTVTVKQDFCLREDLPKFHKLTELNDLKGSSLFPVEITQFRLDRLNQIFQFNGRTTTGVKYRGELTNGDNETLQFEDCSVKGNNSCAMSTLPIRREDALAKSITETLQRCLNFTFKP